jgi:type II secretory pathway predicted ATPase ExeA
MYESIFRLDQRPFAAAPRTDRYFPAGAIDHARQTLARSIERAEGPGLLIGPAGTGKTLLCQLLAEQFCGAFQVVMLASARLSTRRDLLQNILFELDLPYRNMEEGELRLTLIEHLERNETSTDGMLLLIDEAHTLPLRLFEELRMITNLVRDGQPLVRLVMAGGPILEERFANPRLESFNQRIKSRCYLHSFSREETCEFIRAQIFAVGGDPGRLFTVDALRAVYRATDGIPRLINQLCDHALLMASLGGHGQLSAGGIEEAWADLQQLPAPWESSQSAAPSNRTGVVEFGQLVDDEPQEDEDDTVLSADEVLVVDPALQLDRIQRSVDQVSDSTVLLAPPAADSVGPEVQLVLCDIHDPFAETFDEEEIVIDHYAALEATSLRHYTRVTSSESHEMAAALPPPIEPSPNLKIVQDPCEKASASCDEETAGVQFDHLECQPPAVAPAVVLVDRDEACLASDDSLEDSSHDVVAPVNRPTSDDGFYPSIQQDCVALEELDSEQQPAQMHPRIFEDDRDLILVEDEYAAKATEAARSGTKVRRQEYRQLFARLRRGETVS